MQENNFIPILLGTDMNVYGMARAFNEEYGIKPIAIGSHQLAPTKYTKIVDVRLYEGFDKDPVFSEKLVELAKTTFNQKDVKYLLIPCGDGYAELLSQNKEKLSPFYTFVANDYDLFKVLINKVTFYETCEKYGLPYPKTFILTREHLENGQFKQALPFDFPVALKPANSVEWLSIEFEGRKKAFIIDNRKEFEIIVERIYHAGYTSEMIVQDFIPGDDSNMRVLNVYVDHQHNVRMMCLGHPLLEDPAPGSVGNYTVILPDENEQIYHDVAQFLKRINYVGFANFDMKYDSRDGIYKLFEINLRQGRSSFFVTLNGLNLAKFITEDLIFNKPYTNTIYGKAKGEHAKLWLNVPLSIFKKYAKESPDKTRGLELLAQGKYGSTLFYKKDRSLRHYLLMKYVYKKYEEDYQKYFQTKEGL